VKRWVLPAGWGVAVAAVLAAVAFPPPVSSVSGARWFVVANTHYGLSLAAAFAVFGLVYLALARAWQNRWFWRAGSGHLLLMVVGSVLIRFPSWLFGGDAKVGFSELNRISALGYSLTLLGLALFLTALAASVVSWRQSRQAA